MARNLVFLFDGTWFTRFRQDSSHVMSLAKGVSKSRASKTSQVIFYYPGIGTGNAVGRISDSIIKWVGGASGAGYKQVLLDAYFDLCLNYREGDRVFIFGWSRGAFVGRLLAKVVHRLGLAEPVEINSARIPVEAVLRFYTSFGSRKTNIFSESPNVARIEYVGLWDCVSAITSLNEYFSYDMRLPPIVAASRHAVAADEFRRVFKPDLIENIEELNADQDGRTHHQQLFPGDHLILGGGFPIGGEGWFDAYSLSTQNFNWVVKGALDRGLRIGRELNDYDDSAVTAPLSNRQRRLNPLRAYLGFRKDAFQLVKSECFLRRQREDSSYWPKR